MAKYDLQPARSACGIFGGRSGASKRPNGGTVPATAAGVWMIRGAGVRGTARPPGITALSHSPNDLPDR